MSHLIDIEHLSKEEKLRIMEATWEDLSREEEQVDSPEWHDHFLRETEQRLRSGQEKFIDWDDAKKQLRKRFE